MTAHHRSRALTRMRTLGAGCLVTLVALAGAQSASAATGSVQTAEGLHIPSGAVTAPDGRQWVTDHNAGFCRLTVATDSKLGSIEHPQLPGAPETDSRTCLGGLLPDAGPGPDSPGQPAFYDPTPEFPGSGDELALVPDGASPSKEVYRARWNRITKLFEIDPELDTILMDADPDPQAGARPRPSSVSIGPDGNAYVTFQRSATVQRISGLDAPAPRVELIGTTDDGRGAAGVAAGYGPFGPLGPVTVYLSEQTGVLRQIAGVPGSGTAQVTPYDAGAALISQLMYVPTDTIAGDGVLFAGTAEALPDVPATANVDRVLRLDPDGTSSVVAGGFSTVGGFGLRPQNDPPATPIGAAERLVVYDDPAVTIAGEPLGLGRAWAIGGPYTQLLGGPSAPAAQPPLDAEYTADSTPTFTYGGEGTLQCSLVRDTAPSNSFQDCSDPATYTAAALTDGRWRFAVRSVLGAATGPAAVRRFTVDTAAPTAKPIVVNPKPGSTSLRAPRFAFDSDGVEPVAGFECRIDDLDSAEDTPSFQACAEGTARTPGTTEPLSNGSWSIQIRLVDAAGNVGTRRSDGVATVVDDPATTGDEPTPFQVGPDPIAVETDPAASVPLSHPNSAVRYAEGLSIPSGAMEDPKGRIWATDHTGGFCRVTDPTVRGAGDIDHPKLPGQPRSVPRTCLGGFLPDSGEGTDANGPPTFYDPTPRRRGNGDELVFTADGVASSNHLMRYRWDPGTETFEFAGQILVPAVDRANQDRARPVTTQLGPDPDGAGPLEPSLYFSNKRDTYIGRVDDLTSDTPDVRRAGFVSAGGVRAEVLGVGQRTDAGGIKRAVLYFVDQNGTQRIETPAEQGDADAADPSTTGAPYAISDAAGAVVAPSAMQYDLRRDLLYVGTADGLVETDAGIDRVLRWDANADGGQGAPYSDPATGVEAEIGGFTMIQGIGLRSDGRILVVEDKALLDPAEPLRMGVMWQIGGPAARISSGPSNVAGQTALDRTYTADRTPDFGLAGDEDLQCWFRDAGSVAAADFQPCTGATVTAPDLGEGEKVLTVRSTAGSVPGGTDLDDATRFVPVSVRYTVDTVAPATPGAGLTAGELVNGQTSAEPSLKFTDVESGSRLECRLVNGDNDTDPAPGTFNKAPCREGKAFPRSGTPRVTDGFNRVSLRQIDRAGNPSPESSPQLRFRADAVVPIVAISSPDADGAAVGTEAQFEFKADDAGALQYGCRLDGQAFQSCDTPGADDGGPGQPFAIENLADGTVRVTYRNLVKGEHRFSVHASDEHGNISPNATRVVRVDVDSPVAIVDAPGPNERTGPSTALVFHVDPNTINDGETNTLACTLRRGAANIPVSPDACQSGSIPVSGLQSGEHTFTVQATDDAGNAGPVASRTWIVDATGPVITITRTPTGVAGLGFPSFSFTSDEPGTFTCAFDDRAFGPCASVSSQGLRTGTHTFRVRGVDELGNVGSATNTFTFVGNAPPTRNVPQTPTATVRAATVTLAAARATGLPVTVTPGARTTFTQFTVLQDITPPTGQAAAAAKKKTKPRYRPVGQITRKTPKAGHKYKLRLDDRKLRRALKAGNYRIDVRGKDKKSRLSDPTRLKLRIKR